MGTFDRGPSRASMAARRWCAAFVVGALAVAGCGGDDDDSANADTITVDIDGLVVQDDLSAGHVRGEVSYPTSTPMGGDHNPLWQKCGVYTVEVPAERAVHSMEHGAVWIAHRPDVDVSSLELLVAEDEHLLMSPVPGLETPVMLTAWGAQVAVDGPDDPRIAEFIDAFIRNGPEAAPCVGGGVGEPPTEVGPGLDV